MFACLHLNAKSPNLPRFAEIELIVLAVDATSVRFLRTGCKATYILFRAAIYYTRCHFPSKLVLGWCASLFLGSVVPYLFLYLIVPAGCFLDHTAVGCKCVLNEIEPLSKNVLPKPQQSTLLPFDHLPCSHAQHIVAVRAADGGPHYWEEAWAFYPGSLEGELGNADREVIVYGRIHVHSSRFFVPFTNE